MASVSKKAILGRCRMLIDSTLFEKAGEEFILHSVNDTITQETHPIRNVVFQGSFRATYPDSEEQSEEGQIGTVFPVRESYNSKAMCITALEDNSVYYCVLPSENERLISETIELAAGQIAVIEQNKLGFVFGNTYTVNGTPHTSNSVVACESNFASITAVEPCKLLIFESIVN